MLAEQSDKEEKWKGGWKEWAQQQESFRMLNSGWIMSSGCPCPFTEVIAVMNTLCFKIKYW